jgi:hypothetical protein
MISSRRAITAASGAGISIDEFSHLGAPDASRLGRPESRAWERPPR